MNTSNETGRLPVNASIAISAVIPTFNRAQYLRESIQSLVDQSLPPDRFEIIVVDNKSTDGTRQTVEHEFGHVANLRYIYEPIQGLNQARNTAWHHARGKYIAYLDDDAIASPQWLEKILAAFERVAPTPGCVGGKVDPIWEAPRPEWLPEDMVGLLTVLDLSGDPTVLRDNQWLVGANIAFPRSVLEQLRGFQVGLDRTGTKLLSSGELQLEKRIRQLGLAIYYDPAIHVKHLVPSSRLTRKWFLRRWYWQGVSNAIIEIHSKRLPRSVRLRIGLYRLRRLLQSPQNLAHLVLPRRAPGQFAKKCDVYSRVGEVLGLLGVAS